jgi:GT2 family glycosyltransferase
MSRAGHLWDSLTDNTGDRAIGLTLKRLARRAGLGALEPVRIGEPLEHRYDLLVIGGGELLHPPGHSFYDVFRVPGEHVLTSVGVHGTVPAPHLSSYRLVTVRSAGDRDALQDVAREVGVAPCSTVLFDEICEPVSLPAARGATLVHLQPATFDPKAAPRVASLLRSLDRPAALIPFTAYNREADLQEVVARAAGGLDVLAFRGPDEAFAAIRAARAVVVTSLHGALFAYVAGVPFLAVPYAPKVERFLLERGLGERLLPDILDLPAKKHLLSPGSVRWQAALAADRVAARAQLEEVFSLVDGTLSRSAARAPRPPSGWSEPTHPAHAHAQMVDLHGEHGQRIAELAAHELAHDAARRHVERLERLLGVPPAMVSRPASSGPARVHAVTVHRRGLRLLELALGGLLASAGVDLRVVVVANACEEPLPDVVGTHPAVALVRSAEHLSFSEANNRGVEHARNAFGDPDHWLFVNDDVLVEPGTVARLVEALEAAPSAGVAGPLLVVWGAEDVINSLGLNVTRVGEAWDEGIGVPLAVRGPLPPRREVLAVTGSALLVRAAAFRDVRGWSDLYGFYYEDLDLCLEAQRRGWSVVHEPAARAAHAVSATADRVADFKRLHMWRNQLVVVLRHWPATLLLSTLPRLAGGQLLAFFRRLRAGCREDARLQARAWAGALRLLPRIIVARGRDGRTSRDWTRFLRPPGSVPVIHLPALAPGSRPWETPPAAETGGEP